MSSDKNDWFDDLFDLNGDGKTTIDEEFAAFQIINSCKKHKDGGAPYISPPKPKFQMLRPSDAPLPKPPPDLPPKQKYEFIKSGFRAELFACVVISTFVMTPVITVNWALLTLPDRDSGLIAFLTVISLIIGMVVTGHLLWMIYGNIGSACGQLSAAKREYLQSLPADARQRRKKVAKKRRPEK